MRKLSGLRRLLRPFATLRERQQAAEYCRRRQEIARRQRAGEKHLPGVFAVISWGCTATRWLTAALCAHPRIYCVHSFRYVHAPFFPSDALLDDVDSLNLLQYLGRGYALAGDVHGIQIGSVPRLRDYFAERFRAAAIIRDPVKRLLSQISIYERQGYSESIWTDIGSVRELPGFETIAHHYPDTKKRFFMYAVEQLNSILIERQHCPIYRMEDLTSRPDSLCELASWLAGGRLEVDQDWARQMVERPAVNRHHCGHYQPTLSEPWQFEVLNSLVRPETREAYRQQGYSLPDNWSRDCVVGAMEGDGKRPTSVR